MKTLNIHPKSVLQSRIVNIFSNQLRQNAMPGHLHSQNVNPSFKSNQTEIKEKKVAFIKRISPFLLFAVFLMGFFPYLIITGSGPVENIFLLVLLFPFTVINIFYFDWVLWNYFNGKKLSVIWFIELALSLLVYFLITII